MSKQAEKIAQEIDQLISDRTRRMGDREYLEVLETVWSNVDASIVAKKHELSRAGGDED